MGWMARGRLVDGDHQAGEALQHLFDAVQLGILGGIVGLFHVLVRWKVTSWASRIYCGAKWNTHRTGIDASPPSPPVRVAPDATVSFSQIGLSRPLSK